ncbi:MAG: hypothetical protein KDK11_09385, partial [Maritimibacter sp.]|nr:hypothetical protein [Maritimibacter sp.]
MGLLGHVVVCGNTGVFQVGVIGVGSIPLYVVAGQSNAVRIVQSGAIESTLDDRGAGELSIVTA